MKSEATENEKLLPAHSVAERQFYIMVLQCAECAGGGFDRVGEEESEDGKADIWHVRCRTCGSGRQLLFDRSALLIQEGENLPVVAPVGTRSELLDVGQWLALFYTVLGAASETSDKKESRRLGYEATLCLEEALKFYPPDSELPREDAFFANASKERFHEHAEQFTRDRLYRMRERLPSLRVMCASIDEHSREETARRGRPTLRQRLGSLFGRRT